MAARVTALGREAALVAEAGAFAGLAPAVWSGAVGV